MPSNMLTIAAFPSYGLMIRADYFRPQSACEIRTTTMSDGFRKGSTHPTGYGLAGSGSTQGLNTGARAF